MKTHSNSIGEPIVLFIGAKLLSTGNRLFIGLFGTLMLPLLILAFIAYISTFIFGTPCDIDGIREPVSASLSSNLWEFQLLAVFFKASKLAWLLARYARI